MNNVDYLINNTALKKIKCKACGKNNINHSYIEGEYTSRFKDSRRVLIVACNRCTGGHSDVISNFAESKIYLTFSFFPLFSYFEPKERLFSIKLEASDIQKRLHNSKKYI